MWPNFEMDVFFSKLDAIRDLVRIAYGSEGANRDRLFETARDMLRELSEKIESPRVEEDE